MLPAVVPAAEMTGGVATRDKSESPAEKGQVGEFISTLLKRI